MRELDTKGKTLSIEDGRWTVMEMATIIVEPVPDPKPETRIQTQPEKTFLIPYDFMHNKKSITILKPPQNNNT